MPKKDRYMHGNGTEVPLPVALPVLPPGTEDHTDYGYILDWMRRGMPEEEIVYSSDAPPTTEKQWATGIASRFEFTKAKK
jgi:hypothetical protein